MKQGALAWIGVAVLASCSPGLSQRDSDGGQNINPDIDASWADLPDGHVGNAYGDADILGPDGSGACGANTCPNPVADNCIDHEVCGADGTGNGVDDDCNGVVDEGCFCHPGDVKACFLGPPGRRNVGACTDGHMTCTGSSEFGTWGPCAGGIWPTAEACDTVDNNCNGCVDDNPQCCAAAVQCPSSMPDGQPFVDYVIHGTQFYSGAVTTWTWNVTGGPCDQLLYATSGHVSYTLNGISTTMVSGATTNTLTLHPTLSGDYTVKVTIRAANGQTYTCTFIVHIRGPGFRTELCWDKTGSADVDLHVHKSGTTTVWFGTDTSAGGVNSDDCYYLNCKASSSSTFTVPNWGYANSNINECKGGPEGIAWTLLGYCRNPRLDVDNISTPGQPENLNVDNPRNTDKFRIMVHYYGGSVLTRPMVNIYCGGYLKATYGASPDFVGGFTSGGSWGAGPMWRVADVSPQVDASGNTTGCNIQAIHPPGTSSGYYVTNNDKTY